MLTVPRRIAIAYDCLYPFTTGGGERQYRAFAREIATRGNEVEYLTALQWEGKPPTDEPFRVRATSPRLNLYDVHGVRRSAAALSFAWHLFTALRRSRHDYDAVVVSALPVLNVFAARAALWGSRTVVIADYLEVWRRRQWLQYAGHITGTVAWALQRAAIALTPVATCHSELSAQRLRAEGLRGDLLVSPGLIEADITTASDAATPTHPPFALYAGRHIADKQVETIPAAVAKARATVPDLRLVILGSGSSTPEVERAIDAVDGRDWCDLRGFVAQTDLETLMAQAAVLVNPSRREGYGLVVVEAAAHGTPVVLVSGEGNASTELIDEGRNGFIAPSTHADDLGSAIARAVTGGAVLRETTRHWYGDAVENRTIARTIDAILECVDAKSASRSPRRRRQRAENT
ncbi:glycosyltransferase family 4 protein [Microbacterium aurantiacum]|uniref:glycosyltransferase family 4 protein n=1 Tax=Microbacterium aurantiacum TaxID=162393 RepID=UPI0034457602